MHMKATAERVVSVWVGESNDQADQILSIIPATYVAMSEELRILRLVMIPENT